MDSSFGRTVKIRVLFTAWTAFAVFMVAQSYLYRTRVGQEIDLPFLLVSEFSYAYVWALLTPLILRFAVRFRIGAAPLRNGALHAIASVASSAFQKASSGALADLIRSAWGAGFSWERQFQGILAYVDYGLLVYWVIILLKYSIDYYVRLNETELQRSRLEAQLTGARLQALEMQLRPHFLFNTLNAISVLIDTDQKAARQTLGRLGDLLRQSLEQSSSAEIPLRREIDFVDRYLQIEKTRFGDRLAVDFRVDENVLDASVPTMLLQPLVENAVKHGVQMLRGQGRIEIAAHRRNGNLCLRVSDNGKGLGERGIEREGVGLMNTRERLDQMYAGRFTLELRNSREGGFEAIIEIPFRSGTNGPETDRQ